MPRCPSLIALALIVSAALAFPVCAREAHIAGIRYLVIETPGAGQGDALPMIVGLHYSGARPEEMTEYFDQITFPARIVLPQGPYPRRSGYTWFPPDNTLNIGQQARFATEVAESLSTFISSAVAQHPTLDKPIVMGISYGGDLSLLIALRHPSQVRAAFPVAARFLPEWMPIHPCGQSCPPIYAVHGTQDTTVPLEPMRGAMANLRRLGWNAQLRIYSGVAHDFDARQEADFVKNVRRLLSETPAYH